MAEFYSKIVGTTFCDGQKEIKELERGDDLILNREDNNPYDENAVAVYTDYLVKLGYLPKETAKGLRQQVKYWENVSAVVAEITGGRDKNFGCNIFIRIKE